MCVRVDETRQQAGTAEIGYLRVLSNHVAVDAAPHADDEAVVHRDGVGGIGSDGLKYGCVGEDAVGEHPVIDRQ
jgi:hypothetical protein